MAPVLLLSISFSLFLLISVHPKPASCGSVVRNLPGFEGPLPLYLETGYVGVGESDEDQLFYYFIESETNPKEDPLVVWITGGPGCSAWSGLAFEIGPLSYENVVYNGSVPTLLLREHSWTKVASIIFLDSPVGTGFSYSRGSGQNGDIKSSQQVYQFLIKWLADHPQFLSNPLYIGGDSYSGITVPVIAQVIADAIEVGQGPILKLKGYLAGNPSTDLKFDISGRVPFLHGVGVLSDELYQLLQKACEGDYTNPSGNPQCEQYLEEANKCTLGLNVGQILERPCFFASPEPGDTDGQRRSLEEDPTVARLSDDLSPANCRSFGYLLAYYWANNETVRKAIGIRKASINEWRRCTAGLPYVKDVESSLKYHLNLTTKGYRALIYSGDHDTMITHVGTQAWIRSLNFSIIDDWRSWSVDDQIAGYTRTYANNLTFATVMGGGHTAPEYKPKQCLAMVQRWISHNPL